MELQVKRCLQLRRALKKSLKDNFPTYIGAVVEWIRKKKTRTELELQVCSIMNESVRQHHLDFLVSLAKLCWGLSSLRIETSPVPAMSSVATPNAQNSAETSTRLAGKDDEDFGVVLKRKTYTDTSLPGLELIRARLYLAAWGSGITSIDPKVGRLLCIAMRQYVKDIIQTAIMDKPSTSEPEGNSSTIGAFAVWCALSRTNCDRPSIQYEAV